jgi:hypothetical protein
MRASRVFPVARSQKPSHRAGPEAKSRPESQCESGCTGAVSLCNATPSIYLDNGPKNSGRRTQFLKRMVEFADWSGLEVRLVYSPPYHSK